MTFMEVHRTRVLIVDDEPDVRASLLEVLETALRPAEIVTAEDGPTALAHLAEGPFDVVLTDLRMPKMDGLALLTQIRDQWPDTRTILLTAYPNLDIALRAINEGRVRQFLLKPVDFDAIVAAVQDAVWDSRKQAAQQQLVRTLTLAVRSRHGTL